MQHDTSPHVVELGGKKQKVQTASAVLCYSRMLFFQCFPTFQRFDGKEVTFCFGILPERWLCPKVFLTDAVRYFGGATERVMIKASCSSILLGRMLCT
jgi:hypothetical protein